MTTTATEPQSSALQMMAFQRLAQRSLVFSVTRRCPVGCSHCIAESRNAGPVLGTALAQQWAAEFPELYREGVRFITFTGGEPVLALPAIRILADAALMAGMQTAIVTSAFWAKSVATANRIAGQLWTVRNWDFGYDRFHAVRVPLEYLANAVRAVLGYGCSVAIRVCMEDPPVAADCELLTQVREITGPDVTVCTQRIFRAGSPAMDLSLTQRDRDRDLCVSSGPLVRTTVR